jgi:hypothetical protein
MAAFELLLSENSKLFIKSIYCSDDTSSRIHRSCTGVKASFKVGLKGDMSLNSATGLIFRDGMRNFVCSWRRPNCRSQVIDLSLSALVS